MKHKFDSFLYALSGNFNTIWHVCFVHSYSKFHFVYVRSLSSSKLTSNWQKLLKFKKKKKKILKIKKNSSRKFAKTHKRNFPTVELV